MARDFSVVQWLGFANEVTKSSDGPERTLELVRACSQCPDEAAIASTLCRRLLVVLLSLASMYASRYEVKPKGPKPNP